MAEYIADDVEKTTEEESNGIAAKPHQGCEEKRESLLILAILGTTKEYLGEELSKDKMYKLSQKDVEMYFYRYQIVRGKKVSDVLMEKGIQLAIRMISHFIPIDDSEKLVQDLENIIGLLLLKGGRFVAQASGLIQIANHVVLSEYSQDADNMLKTLDFS